MDVADVMSRRSRCVRAQIGAVIVSSNNRIASTGYNGPAATFPEQGPCSNFCPRAMGTAPLDNTYDTCPSIHAEENAIAYVDRSRIEGGTIFVTGASCMRCAKLISNSGITCVVMRINPGEGHRRPDEVIAYLEKCGLKVIVGSYDAGV